VVSACKAAPAERPDGLHRKIEGSRLRALVDGVETLALDDLRYEERRGPIGLFVDDGTRGYFRGLRVGLS
jgi:hypothetical protein